MMERFLKPELSRPPDFALFWAKTWKSLMSVEPELHCEAASAHGRIEHELLKLSFESLGRPRRRLRYSLARPREKTARGAQPRLRLILQFTVEMGSQRIQRGRHTTTPNSDSIYPSGVARR
jgi:cephalosporin-C deacetylase-like acetyl esterase